MREGLHLKKGHLYHFVVTHRSTHHRTYFTHEASYTDADGRKVVMPLPYGDTLGDTIRLAADAQVDFVTFSTDTSWGCMNWWAPPGELPAYGRIDREFEHIIAANPNALIMPRVCADAPGWMLERDPSLRMVFDKGYPVRMSSVSARPYREAACAEVEKLTRHLRGKFPRNFAGLHVSGQNSAEWFYMMSQSGELSGYDVHTRDAFRAWLAKRGEKDAATAEVHFYTPPLKATVCAAEGYVVVQAREAGPLEIDFGNEDLVVDFLTGKQIGVGPKVSLPFQKGETRIFRLANN